MTTWQRFGDGTWVNVDHLEVVRVDEQDDGTWQLTATFTSGHTHPLGSHTNRDLLVDCTDALLRGEVGEHLEALTDSAEPEPAAPELGAPEPAAPELQPAVPAGRRSWRFWRSGPRPALTVADGPLDPAVP